MQIDVIDRLEDFAELKDNWDSVYAADPEAKFFLSWTWLSRWLETERIDWFILAAKPDPEASSYVAFFPLKLRTRLTEGGGFHNRISMAGSRIADYTGFICAAEFQDRAIPALADHMTRMHWAKLEMRDFCVSDERLRLFLQYFAEPEFKTRVKESDVQFNIEACKCPSVSLPADWDSYLNDRLGSNTRQKIRRFLRKVENSTDFRITYAEDGTVGRDLDILLRFWKAKWGHGFAEAALEGVLKSFRTMLLHCFESGVLFLPILWKGEVPLAALACLTDAEKGSLLFFIGGRDETFRSPPPGFVLHAHSIRYAIGKGLTTYDFLRGDEAYKYAFGAEDRRNKYVVVTTANGRNLGDRLDPRSVSTVLRHSGRLRRKGRLSEAETGYRQILDVEPRSVEALFGLGRLLAAKGDHRAATKSFRSCVALDPKAYQSWFRLGQSLAARREFSDAADAYREVLKLRPESSSAHKNLGEVLLQIGQVEGAGWMYRFPKDYDRVIGPRFNEVREEAFDYLFKTGVANLGIQASCLDLACGTGITTIGLAKRRSGLAVIGVDSSEAMLAEARHRAEREGLSDRCRFKKSDVHELTPDTLAEVTADGRRKVEMITCALGYSVIPNWEAAFNQTLQLLEDDGVYVIFDQFEPKLYLPEFDANTSRESWKLLEQNFLHVDIKWFGNMFIAIGQKKRADQLPARAIMEQAEGFAAESLYERGKQLANKGDHRAAAQSFRSCVALEPKAYKAWSRLGKSLAAQQEFSGAADVYREALKLRPESYSAHRKLSEVLSRIGQVEGAWRYQFPEAYDRGNIPWIGEVRRKAFDYLLNTGIVDFKTPAMCLDLACVTGITTLSLAEYRRELLVIGIDASRQMLAEARRKAEKEGLTGRCSFREADVLNITLSALPELEKHGRKDVDMITCALGFSVFPRWEEAFHRTNQLLHDDGVYVIFDQYLSGDTGLAHPGFAANQSRESWKLLEQNFVHVDIKWFGDMFIAIGRKKKARSVPSVPIEVEHHG